MTADDYMLKWFRGVDVGPKSFPPKSPAQLEILRGDMGRWHWTVKRHDGQTIALCTERGYRTREQAYKGAVQALTDLAAALEAYRQDSTEQEVA